MAQILNPRRDFMAATYEAAKRSGHIFPDYATCEAALESGFGSSVAARKGNNLFDLKHQDGELVKYPDVAACFADRMARLKRLAEIEDPKQSVHYAAALATDFGEQFVIHVSQDWIAPRRAQKVLKIYQQYSFLFV